MEDEPTDDIHVRRSDVAKDANLASVVGEVGPFALIGVVMLWPMFAIMRRLERTWMRVLVGVAFALASGALTFAAYARFG